MDRRIDVFANLGHFPGMDILVTKGFGVGVWLG